MKARHHLWTMLRPYEKRLRVTREQSSLTGSATVLPLSSRSDTDHRSIREHCRQPPLSPTETAEMCRPV